MKATAKLRFLRMSPRKVRLVADMVRGKKLDQAMETLNFLNKRAARPLAGLIESAAANAGNKEGMDTDSLFISAITVDEGPTMKRFMPRAMGRATMILKRSSHVNVTLEDAPKKSKPTDQATAESAEKPAEVNN